MKFIQGHLPILLVSVLDLVQEPRIDQREEAARVKR